MGYENEVAKICRLQNGFELQIYDPSPKEEKEAKKDAPVAYHSGWRNFAFSTEKDLVAFLSKKLPSLTPSDFDKSYQSAFDAGVASEMPKVKK